MKNLHLSSFYVFYNLEKLQSSLSRLFLISVLSIYFVSCTKESQEPDVIVANTSDVTLKEIDTIIGQLSVSGNNKNSRHLRAGDYTIGKFYNGRANNFLYVINFGEKDGFIIMSSNKKVKPILAFSESGTFNLSETRLPEGLTFWLDSHIQYVDSLGKSESPILENAWRVENIRRLIGEKLNFDLPNAKIANPPFPPEEGCTPTTITKASLGTISWNQGTGYNDQCPYMSCSSPSNGRALTGCVATAMGEIMYYHNKPSSVNWSGMNPNGSANADIALLLYVIGGVVDMDWGCAGSGAYMSDAKDAFKVSFGYSNAKKSSYNIATLQDQLNNNRPVMIAGGNHAWVTDGYYEYQYEDCSLYYLHFWMNWGWGGNFNGWYGTSAFNPDGRNYNSNVTIIYDLY